MFIALMSNIECEHCHVVDVVKYSNLSKNFLLMWIKYTKKIPLHSHMLTDSPNNILEYLNFTFKW
jgi:hypothetical protein